MEVGCRYRSRGSYSFRCRATITETQEEHVCRSTRKTSIIYFLTIWFNIHVFKMSKNLETNGLSSLTYPHRQVRVAHSYLPGGANVHPDTVSGSLDLVLG